MKLALIGDVHQEDIALDIVLEHIRERDLIDAIWCVGDLAHGEGDFFRTCELLMKHEVVTVLGNHDRWFLDEEGGDLDERSRVKNIDDVYAYLLSLSETHRVKSVHGDIVLAHGVGRDDMTRISFDASPYDFQQHQEFQRLKNEKCYASVGGHVHQVFTRQHEGVLMVNPGTLKRSYIPGYLEWHVDEERMINHVLTGKGVQTLGEWSVREDTRMINRIDAPRNAN